MACGRCVPSWSNGVPMPSEGRAELVHPEAAGWLLGTLDPAEADGFRRHLPDCPHCQAAMTELAPVRRALHGVPPPVDPPPGLEARTVAAVLDAASRKQRPGKTARQSWWPHRNARLLSAVAVAAAIAVVAVLLTHRTPSPRTAPSAAAVIDLHSPSGTAASGRAVATRHAGGWSIRLTVRGLTKLRPGQFYECWYAPPTTRPGHQQLITAGTFTTGPRGSGSFSMWSAADPHVFKTMEITAERPGDARQHGQLILTGQAR